MSVNTFSKFSEKIKRGKIKEAGKVIVYGVEGAGKSILASKSPNPIIIDFENGCNHIDCARLQMSAVSATKSGESISLIDFLTSAISTIESSGRPSFPFDTIVIDPIDKMEDILISECLAITGSTSLYAGYEKSGYSKLVAIETIIQTMFDTLISYGVNIMIVAHCEQKKISEPGLEPRDCFALKLEKKTASMWSEWVNEICFLKFNERMVEVSQNGKSVQKIVGGRDRVLYTSRTVGYVAKHRNDIPDEINISDPKAVDSFYREVFLTKSNSVCSELSYSLPEVASFFAELGDDARIMRTLVGLGIVSDTDTLDSLPSAVYTRIMNKREVFRKKFNETK